MFDLSSDKIVARAIAMADLREPPTVKFRANLDALVGALGKEAGLRADAAPKIEASLAVMLRNQLEVSDWVTRHPEIRDERIEEPIFLTGLPRSGTTYFQYLFDPDPGMRMLRYWEGQRTCPPPGHAPDTIPPRIAECAAEKAAASSDPLRAKIAQIHLSDADGPEECLKIIDQTFVNVGDLWTYCVPEFFRRCIDEFDLEAVYAHHKLVLQLLQWQGQQRRWVLKWPCHLVALEAILANYPDARFIVTHRDPVQVLASNCSLAAMLRQSTAESVDLAEIGQQMKGMLHVYLDRLVAFDAQHGERVAHVDYRTAVDEPERAVALSLGKLGIAMPAGLDEAIRVWRADNPPGKRGTHDYRLSDYGLDAGQMAAEFAYYTDRFVPSAAASAA